MSDQEGRQIYLSLLGQTLTATVTDAQLTELAAQLKELDPATVICLIEAPEAPQTPATAAPPEIGASK